MTHLINRNINDSCRGQSDKIEVKFIPRRVGEYCHQYLLEYHVKGSLGLAKTIKKESIELRGEAKGVAIKLKPSSILFEPAKVAQARKSGTATIRYKSKAADLMIDLIFIARKFVSRTTRART